MPTDHSPEGTELCCRGTGSGGALSSGEESEHDRDGPILSEARGESGSLEVRDGGHLYSGLGKSTSRVPEGTWVRASSLRQACMAASVYPEALLEASGAIVDIDKGHHPGVLATAVALRWGGGSVCAAGAV